MSTKFWLITVNIVLLLSSTLVNAHFGTNSKRQDRSILYSSSHTNVDDLSGNQANEQQIELFRQLLLDQLELKEPPNVTIDTTGGTGIPSSIVKQLEQQAQEQEYLHHMEENSTYERENIQRNLQVKTERAVLPGDFIPNHTCQRQLSSKLNLMKDNGQHVLCFRFTRSAIESRGLPTNQLIKNLRFYIKKTYFYPISQLQYNKLTPNMFHIYQVYRPTANDTSHKVFSGFTDTMRLIVAEVNELDEEWLELKLKHNQGQTNIHQIYKQFITPWYGFAINQKLQIPFLSNYRRHHSRKHLDDVLRRFNSDTKKHDFNLPVPYMLVDYGEKNSSTSGHREARGIVKGRPARICDSNSSCCRRQLVIDFDQGGNAFNFIIHPRQLDIGECIGLCGISGSSLKYTDVKNAQHRNEPHASYNLLLLHSGTSLNRSSINTQVSQQSRNCCSYTRTGGFELVYHTTGSGPIIRKYIPNMVVEECRCGLPATIQQV